MKQHALNLGEGFASQVLSLFRQFNIPHRGCGFLLFHSTTGRIVNILPDFPLLADECVLPEPSGKGFFNGLLH